MIPWLHHPTDPLPDTRHALPPGSDAPGLLAAGGELTPQRLGEAYTHGVFPWYSAGQPVLWWSPDPRMVLLVDEFRLSRSLRKTVRRFAADARCELRIDSAFRQVIGACAGTPREGQNGTWIVPEMLAAYADWARAGDVHSVETWMDGELVGGLYGVNLGRMMFGESMFSHRTDASKIALAGLVAFCRWNAMPVIDCQQATGHLASLGAAPIARAEFEGQVQALVARAPAPVWAYDFRMWSTLALGAPSDPPTDPTPAPPPP